nr:unnamed protein product [Spirometra erinaceieuropaei]
MDDDPLPKRLFYGDVATGSRRQGGPNRRYKDTLKSSLKLLQINPTNWEELACDRPAWRRTVKTGAAIHEANRIAAAKAKREARKSQLRPPASSSSSLPPNNSVNSSAPPLPSSSSSSSSSSNTTTIPTTIAPTAAAQAAVSHISDRDTTTGTTPASPDSSKENQDYTCPHCDRTFTSHIGLVGHLRIHRTETGEPVPEAPTYTHRTRLHCPRTFTHRMGLFGHMRIHESGIDHNSDTPTTPIMPSTTLAPSICATINASSVADSDTADFTCPVTCESIAQRPENQCLEHQPTPNQLVSTVHTVLALSGTAWAYSATCASTTTCGRQPPVTPHIHTLPTLLHHHQHTSTLTHRMHQLPPSTQAGSVHLVSVPMQLRLYG